MKRALLVGINNYEKLGKDSNLNGCVNDVLNIRDILKTFYGFTNDDIHVVTDERATGRAILERLENMVKNAQAGDQLLFHFSGHGSQIRDRDGDELADGLDEILCPYDMDWDNTYITDDDLASALEKLNPAASMEVLLDCCHSGTGIRGMGGLIDFIMTRDAEPGHGAPSSLPRFLPPPIDIACRAEGTKGVIAINKLFLTNQYLSKPVLWAGCKSSQTSADAFIGGKYNGAFTYTLCEIVRRSEGKVSRAELIKRMRQDLRDGDFDQEPQLETSEPGKITSNFFEG